MSILYIRDGSGKFFPLPAIGEAGFSPTIVVTPIEGGNRLTITDVNGTQTVDLMNGSMDEITVDNVITETGENPVNSVAVVGYAMPKTAIVATTTDPGAGATVNYPEGTVILVYE